VTDSLSGLKSSLEMRFGSKAFPDKHRIELRNRRRKQDESLQSLHGDIRRLAALAFPGMPSQMREVTACDHFLDALGDPDFALKIRERHPSNLELDVALQTALRLEAWTADTTRCCEVRKNEQGESNVLRIFDKIANSIDVFQKKVEQKFAEFEKRILKRPKNGGFLNNCRQLNSNRHIAPNFGSSGPKPANSPTNYVHPPGINRTNCNGNFNRLSSCRRISCLSRRQDLEESRTAEVPEQRPARSKERAENKAVRSKLRSTRSKRRTIRPDQRYQEESEQHATNLKQIICWEKSINKLSGTIKLVAG